MNYSEQLIESLDESELDQAYELAISILGDECEADFFKFLTEFWDVIIPEPLIVNWHIKYLCRRLQAFFEQLEQGIPPGDLVINIPPGTSKSTIVTIMFPVWGWIRRPALRVISGSYAAALAIEHSVKSRDIIKSPKFRQLYPNRIQLKQDQDNKGFYENQDHGRRISTSIGGTATGFHADLIVIDDPINPKMAASEVERVNANDWIEKTLANRKTDKTLTPTVIVMQRLNEDDPTGRKLQRDEDFTHICLPAELTDLDNVNPPKLALLYKDGLLDPVRMPRPVLEQQRLQLGSIEYGGQYLQSPRDAEGNIFKREWFQFYDELPAGRPLRIFDSWDTAYKTKQENDFSVCTTWGEYEKGFYLLDFFQEKIEYVELKQQIQIRAKKNRSHVILIEDKASGQSAIQELKRINVPIKPVTPHGDKILRANQITPPFEAGNVYFPVKEFSETIIEQMTGFPNTKHDDIVDSITQALNWAREKTAGIPIIASSSGNPRKKRTSTILRGFR